MCRKWVKRCLHASILLFIFPLFSGADIGRAILYPSSAFITEKTKVKLTPEAGALKKAVFSLPPAADPQTLIITMSENAPLLLTDYQYRKVDQAGQVINDGQTRKLAKLKQERAAQRASLYSAEAQIQFWQSQTKTRSKTPQDAMNLAATIARNTKKSWQEKAAIQTQMEITEQKIKEILEEQKQADTRRRASWEITAWFSGPEVKEAVLRYTYVLNDCGWQPVYRLNALTGEKMVIYSREAEIWQNSGQDWHQMEIILSLQKMPTAAITSETTPWHIQSSVSDSAAGKSKARVKRKAKSKTDSKDNAGSETPPSDPSNEQRYFQHYAAGSHNLAAGQRVRIALQEEKWPAEFLHSIRPRESSHAFLTALIRLPDTSSISEGNTVYMIDGILTGKRTFALSGREGTVFLGVDPKITFVTSMLPVSPEGEERVTEKQHRTWKRQIDIHNQGTGIVKVKIEEPTLLPGDTRIKATLNYHPEPVEQTRAMTSWLMDIPAGEKRTVTININMEAPSGLKLDMGW